MRSCRCGPTVALAGSRVARPRLTKLGREVRLIPALELDRRARELIFGGALQALAKLGDGPRPGACDRRTMLGHLLFKRREPGRVGRHVVGQQLVPRAHRRFVSRAMVRMARLQREHQPIEEATAVAGRADEQPVHRGCQPKHGQPLAQGVHGSRRGIDADLAALRRERLRAGADLDVAEPRGDREPAPAVDPRHLRQRRTTKSASWAEQRHGLEQVGLARPILSGQQDEACAGLDQRRRVGPEIGEGEAADRHSVRLSRYCSRRSRTSKCAARSSKRDSTA